MKCLNETTVACFLTAAGRGGVVPIISFFRVFLSPSEDVKILPHVF